MNSVVALILCLLVGLFLLVGLIFVFKTKKDLKLIDFSIALAFSVLITLGFLEILPESLELVSSKLNNTISYILVFVLAIVGIAILKIIDIFVPNHSHSGNSSKNVLKHIAVITTVAIFIHNIIEGMALYSSFIISFKTGIIFSIGISLHNIALGLLIGTGVYHSNKSKRKTFNFMLVLALSTFVGSLIMSIFNVYLENNVLLGAILSLTLGMIVYITVIELLPLIINTKNKKITSIGIISGLLIMTLTMFI